MSEFKEFSVAVANKEQFEAVRDVLEGMGYTAYASREFCPTRLLLSALADGWYYRTGFYQSEDSVLSYNQFMQEYGKKESHMTLHSYRSDGCDPYPTYYIYSPEGAILGWTDNKRRAMYFVNELDKRFTKE